jgi:hypothetical protein
VTERSIDYTDQMTFMNLESEDRIKKKIKEINIDQISPLDALLKIKELQDNIDD